MSASAVVIHYEEALYQVYAPLPLPFTFSRDGYACRRRRSGDVKLDITETVTQIVNTDRGHSAPVS